MMSYWRMAFIFGPALIRGEIGSMGLYLPFMFGFICRAISKEIMRVTKIAFETRESKKRSFDFHKHTVTPVMQLLAFCAFIYYFEGETKNLPNFFFSSFVSPLLRHYFPLYGDALVYSLIISGLSVAWVWQGIDSLFLGFLFLQGIPEIQRHLWLKPKTHIAVVVFFILLTMPFASIGIMAWWFPDYLQSLPTGYLKFLCYVSNALPSVDDYYAVLGLDKSANQSTIGSTYRRLARQLHPDKTKNLPEVERLEATEKFRLIAEANEILSRPERRLEFDEQLQNPELKELIPRCVAALVMMGYWLLHLLIDVNDFETNQEQNKQQLRNYISNGQPVNHVGLGIDPQDLHAYVQNEENDVPVVRENKLVDIIAFRELLKDAGYALAPLPEEMEKDPLTQLLPKTKAAEVAGNKVPDRVIKSQADGFTRRANARKIETKLAQRRGYMKRQKDSGGCLLQ